MSYPFSSLKAPELPEMDPQVSHESLPHVTHELHGPFTIQLSEPEIKNGKS